MMGSNPKAAKFSGLRNDRLTIRTHIYASILAAIGGLIMLANYNSAKADYGSAYTLQCILIVVLGGVNPDGGFGKVFGVTVAIFTLQILSSGLNMFPQISNFYRPLIWGGVLLIVLMTNYLLSSRSSRRISRSMRQVKSE
jgi:simple sugar transport system permease protein